MTGAGKVKSGGLHPAVGRSLRMNDKRIEEQEENEEEEEEF